MPEDVVLVEMTRDQAEVLSWPDNGQPLAIHWQREASVLGKAKLRAALDAPPVKRVEEYRVVGRHNGRLHSAATGSRRHATARAKQMERDGYTGARIQHRTVTRTQWRDLEEGSDE